MLHNCTVVVQLSPFMHWQPELQQVEQQEPAGAVAGTHTTGGAGGGDLLSRCPVSYTHLTLPTILRV